MALFSAWIFEIADVLQRTVRAEERWLRGISNSHPSIRL